LLLVEVRDVCAPFGRYDKRPGIVCGYVATDTCVGLTDVTMCRQPPAAKQHDRAQDSDQGAR
jgi:hypothetical protein